ncbi:TrbC/VirB2 family protein [Rhizobium laguerreae]|uniref:TrbC/VirB2 family protein n=1 Tax=Rhizobium laguerreae TaxID=1076926 RepID=UPI001C918D68|nr:TrbC/VirB2 family protein [Rhizobium laguerreae]MBY3349127.1 TrbC/VirB2 family protein [Rhizobium laguerreae]MBY3356195.1 TrbC/VirB2 family protein [Rhizobium laguerreae]MBY3370229.1 TrbC/VirB2 family protein [Rhizobium laguerreae]MBY3377270.1 TrbC/VirB2 family protein [Rhizobium laguerreae]MBY3432496.1 TrbC/VirB2 family protein [Rhizobium laguerreae]
MGSLKKHLLNKNSPKLGAMIVGMVLLSSNPSAAQDFSGVTSFLEAIVEAVTGPIGVAISALAVMAIGFAFMTGRMDWTFAVSIIIGIAIVFGGASFVQGITAH